MIKVYFWICLSLFSIGMFAGKHEENYKACTNFWTPPIDSLKEVVAKLRANWEETPRNWKNELDPSNDAGQAYLKAESKLKWLKKARDYCYNHDLKESKRFYDYLLN